MKLLFVLGSFYPAQSGGPNNSVYWMSKELVRRGINVSVVALKDGLNMEQLERHSLALGQENSVAGIRAWYFDYFFSRYLSFGMFRWLLTNIKRYDMVNLTSFFFPWTWFAALLCIFYRIPFSVAPRGELEPGAYRFGRARKDLANGFFLKRLMARARFVLVTSEQEECFSRPYFPQEMAFETMPNYIEIEGEALQPEAILEKRDILYLGRVHPKKGIENMIDAFNLLDSATLGSHRLLIVGTGDKNYLKALKKKVAASERSSAIHFLGHRTGQEKRRIYASSKVMVLPSYSENFGNVVVEALVHSTPVIASRFTPWSGLEKAGCGRWVDNAPVSLAWALELVLSLNSSSYEAMAKAARQFAEENYDIKTNSASLESLYRRYLR